MEEIKHIVHDNLFIHKKYCSSTLLNGVIECFLCEKWIRSVKQDLKYSKPPYHPSLSPNEVESSLQLGESIGDFWQRILIQVLPKKEHDVFTLPRINNLLKSHLANDLSYSQLLHYVSSTNMKNLWKDSYQRFGDHAIIKQWKEWQKMCVEPQSKVLRNALQRLYKCPIIPLKDEIEVEGRNSNKASNQGIPDSCNIHRALFIVEGLHHFFVFLEPSGHSVWDCVNFSPAKFKENECGGLFILYQLLEGMQSIQDCGLFLGNISLHYLRLGPDFHLSLIPRLTDSLLVPDPPSSDLSHSPKEPAADLEPRSSLVEGKSNAGAFLSLLSSHDAKSVIDELSSNDMDTETSHSRRNNSLLHLTQKWVVHEISNFDYLLCLSYFAGHSFDSPVFYPTLPWVTDFTSPNGGWRDLTKSKYRLNKGDQQLDHTYKLAESDPHLDQIAHHIPEYFSEVTYYVYKARVTPKEILKRRVRQQFVASHYPSSIARMYALTPEECIPEFYCDPSVFKSIHEDLLDLEVPHWCENVHDFLRLHRGALESNYVSRRLHYWIDLYYGYKLTGSASITAKNVCLPLVDNHASLSRGGIVQLFNVPHPAKLTPSPFLSRSPPLPFHSEGNEASPHKASEEAAEGRESCGDINPREEDSLRDHLFSPKQSKGSSSDDKNIVARIELPMNYNPLTALNQVEMLYNFLLRTSGKLPGKLDISSGIPSSVKQAAHYRRVRDMQVLGCLILQIFAPSKCRIISSNANLEEMFRLSRKILQESNDIPKCLHHSLNLIFQRGEGKSASAEGMPPSKFNVVASEGLPPPSCHQMLQPLVNVISFPVYFPRLSRFVKRTKEFSALLGEECWYGSYEDQGKKIIQNHIRRTFIDLKDLIPHLPSDGLYLVLPHVLELYENPVSAAFAAWYLTDIVAQALGPLETRKRLLPHLIKLFDVDSVVFSDHLNLFHHTFLLQLMVRIGLKTFLLHFIPPIIEGAGGYKAPLEASKQVEDEKSKQSKILRNEQSEVDGEEASVVSPSEEDLRPASNSDSSGRAKVLKRRNSSVRSPSGADTDITDAENDTEIFVFEGGDDEDTLNDFGVTPTIDLTDSSKSPVSDTVSLDEESLQEGGGSTNSLCHAHSPPLSGEETEDPVGSEDTLCSPSSRPSHASSTFHIPINHSKLLGISPQSNVYSTSLPENPLNPRVTNFEVHEEEGTTDSAHDSVTTSCTSSSPFKMDSEISLAEICCENIMWLAHRLGPVLTARHLSRNLLRMLSLCYLPESGSLTILPSNPSKKFSVTKKEIAGDSNATRILYCLSEISNLYGEQVILLQYLSHITELVSWCGSKLTTSQEAGLIGAMSLLQHLLLKLSDVTFMDYLQETLIRNTVYPVIRLLASVKVFFPNGSSVRSILAWRVIDSLCIMVRRVGREMSKEKLTPAITRFLTAFDKVHSSKWQSSDPTKGRISDDITEVKMKGYDNTQDNKERALEELRKVFTPEMAYLSYVPLCRFLGTKFMEDSLPNHDLLRSLWLQYDETNQGDYATVLSMEGQSSLDLSAISPCNNSGTTNVAVTGNRIDIKDPSDSSCNAFDECSFSFELEGGLNFTKYFGNKMENSQRHLRGNWLAYWEHEIGRNEQEHFNFKQIKLQTFVGHSNSVKSFVVLNNENSFMSCSKDKTVKLWSLRSQGDGSTECSPQWTYGNHKKSVFDVVFSESMRLAASCDSTVHIWDPFTGTSLKQLDSLQHSPVTVLSSVPPPSTQLVTATTDSTLKLIDLRTYSYTHELKITTSSVGRVRCLATSNDSHLVAVAHSSGVIATLDLRMGQLLATWKPHEGEVLTLNWYNAGTFISSALDQTICVWSVYDSNLKYHLKGPSEPVHLLKVLEDEVLSGTTANRIGLHSAASPDANFSCTRLRTDTFRGVLTAMEVLPLNRQLLLGADNGTIKLLC